MRTPITGGACRVKCHSSKLESRYNFDFYQRLLGKLFHCKSATSGIGLAEILIVDLVHGHEKAHICQEYGALDHIVESSAYLGQNSLDVFNALGCLGLDVFGHAAVSSIDGELAGYIYKTIGYYGLAVRADGAGSAGALDFFFLS